MLLPDMCAEVHPGVRSAPAGRVTLFFANTVSRVRPARHVRRGTPGGPLSTSGPRGIFSAAPETTLGPAAVTIPNALSVCSNGTKSLLGGAHTPQAALVSPALHHRRLKIMLKLHRRAKKSDLTIFSLLWVPLTGSNHLSS